MSTSVPRLGPRDRGLSAAWTPSAPACQGHSTRVAYRPAPDAITIAELWEVGAYALGIRLIGVSIAAIRHITDFIEAELNPQSEREAS